MKDNQIILTLQAKRHCEKIHIELNNITVSFDKINEKCKNNKIKEYEKKYNECEKKYEEAIKSLDIHIKTLIELFSNNNTNTYEYMMRYLNMWKMSPPCFTNILFKINENGYFENVTVPELIEVANKNQYLESFSLTENDGCIYITGPNNFKTSPCFACHISSGSHYNGRYRHVNFMTRTGSVYWSSGLVMDDDSLKLLKKLYILTK